MKKLPILLLAALLTLCSCNKSYQELVNEKVEQYKKEGKIILNKSDDPTGKEHYIVFADAKQQTIGVDTLGEEALVIKLDGLVEKQIDIPGIQCPDKFHVISNDPNLTLEANFKIDKDGSFSSYEDRKATVYKDKYIVLESDDLGFSKKWSILWFKSPENIYTYQGKEDKDVVLNKENGDIKMTIKSAEAFNIIGYGKEWIETTYNVTFNYNGKIKQQDDYVDYEGTSVPIGAFGDITNLQPYIERIENSIIIGNAQSGIY